MSPSRAGARIHDAPTACSASVHMASMQPLPCFSTSALCLQALLGAQTLGSPQL